MAFTLGACGIVEIAFAVGAGYFCFGHAHTRQNQNYSTLQRTECRKSRNGRRLEAKSVINVLCTCLLFIKRSAWLDVEAIKVVIRFTSGHPHTRCLSLL